MKAANFIVHRRMIFVNKKSYENNGVLSNHFEMLIFYIPINFVMIGRSV